ncbi:GGDEF domain-containing protein [Mycolicibacterium mengxianglii]|uniref:GGDEF domain-containing protein n=1 Tax=Mycolicibacterium mengxianglii TaxID=2736649 RepID=UPI0018EF2FD2|nr:sensor domain-containing diguanylate cyclase [Mycolicibacterium mengxianglii]
MTPKSTSGNLKLSDLLDAADTNEVHVLRALLQMSHAVLCANYFDEALEQIAHHSLLALGAASVSISRWDRDDDMLHTLINVGDLGPEEERWPENEVYSVNDERKVMQLLRQGLPYLNSIDDIDQSPENLAMLRWAGKESEVAVPVMYNDTIWGEIWATGVDGRRFGPGDIQVLQAIAAHTAVAIGRSELFSAVWGQAFEDPLTGLANRRRLDEIFDSMDVDEVRPALLVCDLDNFKEVNDQHGHPAGDALLRIVAHALDGTAATTAGSLVARMGGDEFCIVLPRSTLADAERFAVDATRAIIEEASQHVSLSWGAAISESAIATGPALVAAADAALLQSKRLGPGRFSVGIADQDAVPPPEHRRRGADQPAPDIVARVVEVLDAHRPKTAATALQTLAVHVCHAVNAAAWSVSVMTEDGEAVRSLRGIDSSRDGASGLRVLAESEDETYRLADYPATAEAIATGGAFVAAVDLPDSDPNEVELLEKLGYFAVLAVGVTDGSDRFLVEIYSDTAHTELAAIRPHVRVLAHYCCTVVPDPS